METNSSRSRVVIAGKVDSCLTSAKTDTRIRDQGSIWQSSTQVRHVGRSSDASSGSLLDFHDLGDGLVTCSGLGALTRRRPTDAPEKGAGWVSLGASRSFDPARVHRGTN